LRTDGFKTNFIPGLCLYKFFYVWLDLQISDGERSQMLGWLYWLPNPLLPFIWFRVTVPQNHAEIVIEEVRPEEAPPT